MSDEDSVQEHPETEREQGKSSEAEASVLENICKRASIGLFGFDTDLRYTYINEWLAAINGLSVEEHLGRRIGEVLPDVAAGVERQLRSVIETGAPIIGGEVEAETPADPGRKRVFQHNYHPLKSSNGTISGVVGTVLDITDRKRAEEASARLTAILEATPDFVGMADAGGDLRYMNPAGRKLVGVAKDEDVSTTSITGYHPEWMNILLKNEVLPTAVREGSWVGEGAFLHRNGHEIPVLMVVLAHKASDGTVQSFSTISRDITERKQAEEKRLRQSEQKYRNLFEYANDSIFIVDPSTYQILDVNENAARRLGYDRNELLNLTLQDLAAPAVKDRIEPTAKELKEKGSIIFEHAHQRKDGSEYPVEISSRIIDYGDREVIQSFVRDITERKQLETQLRLTQFSMDRSGIAAFWIGPDARFVFVNDAACDVLGYSREELLSMTVHDIDPDFPAAVWPEHWEEIKRRGSFTLESRHRTKEGRIFPVEIMVNYLQFGGQEYNFAFARDITMRKQAEAEIHSLKTFYEQILDGIPAQIAVFDTEGRYLYVNPAGISRPERRQWVIGRTDIDYCRKWNKDESIARTRRTWQCRAITEKDVVSFEEELMTASGEPRYVLRLFSPVIESSGEVSKLIGYGLDLTDHKHLEDEFRQSQKMEAMGQLAGGVAHDFNNMLSIILGYSEVMLTTLSRDDPLRKKIAAIRDAGERSGSLTRQLLAFSRKQVLQPRVLDLNAVVSNVEKMLKRLISEDIEFVFRPGPNLGQVEVDPGQIEQVILNLVVNARDAMPQGGELTIQTSSAHLDEDYVSRHSDSKIGPHVVLTVSDTGIGMDRKTQERIFEPFFTTKEEGKGTGLGLSTIYGIVKQSGGSISITSKLGEGTNFKVYLPRTKGSTDVIRATSTPVSESRSSETILVVEDEEVVRELACEILRGSGYNVLEAANAGEALLICEQHGGSIHLLLTDVVMPRMSGRVLADRLATLHAEMKVLFMSGYTDDAIVHHGVLDGSTPFLEKPLTPAALTQKVREVLDTPAEH